MPSRCYTTGTTRLSQRPGTDYVGSTAIKCMLMGSGYTFNVDHAVVTLLAAGEITATNYDPGFGNAGRRVLAGKSIDANLSGATPPSAAVFRANDITWTSIGGAQNATIEHAAIIEEITNDAGSIPIWYLDTPTQATNGGDLTLQFASGIVAQQNI